MKVQGQVNLTEDEFNRMIELVRRSMRSPA